MLAFFFPLEAKLDGCFLQEEGNPYLRCLLKQETRSGSNIYYLRWHNLNQSLCQSYINQPAFPYTPSGRVLGGSILQDPPLENLLPPSPHGILQPFYLLLCMYASIHVFFTRGEPCLLSVLGSRAGLGKTTPGGDCARWSVTRDMTTS